MVTITGGVTIRKQETCTDYVETGTGAAPEHDHICNERTTVYSTTMQEIPEYIAEGVFYGFAMVSVIFIILWVLRKILNIF